MKNTVKKIDEALDQVAGAIIAKEENPTIGMEIETLEAQADFYHSLKDMCKAIDKLMESIIPYKI